ncbi:energy transducer TonB [Croceibacterium ferulae]|uniref:energy transducer TonB n=1 Tax=Croceibacterium ferulae TaxID=1854641 RepID=UPI000EAEC34B|nr:energy transducer TonB [Croceibacterium ferulae]
MHHTGRFRTLLAAGALAAAHMSGPAAATELVLAQASGSKWIMDNGLNSCRLAREFGEGEDRVFLKLEQWAPGEMLSMLLAGQPLAAFAEQRMTQIGFGEPTGPSGLRDRLGYPATLNDRGPAMIFPAVTLTRQSDSSADGSPPVDLWPFLEAQDMAIADRIQLVQGDDTLRLQAASLPQALVVLDTCSRARLTEWGLDAEAHRTLTRIAWPRNLAQLSERIHNNWPEALLDKGGQGAIHVRMIVEPDGSVGECTITPMTNSDLPASACRIFARGAKFNPALDASGAPVRSFWATTVTYTLETGE